MPHTKSRRTLQGRAFLPGEALLRDRLLALGLAVARAQRRRLGRTTLIGVTGSAGKTSTKELVAAVLGAELRGTKSPGNDNRLSRVGRTILRTRPRDAFSVVEVAAWRPGSVAETADLLRPDIAVVTTIGSDHFSAFRSLEATAAEKQALVDALPATGTAVLNADDPHVVAMADGFPGRVITFGEAPGATLRAEDVRSAWPDPLSFTLRHDGRSLPVRTRLNGRYWTTSVLAALGVALAMELPPERALETVAAFETVAGRMNAVRQDGLTFIRDDGKAPLWTMRPLLEFVTEARAPRKVLVIGSISDYNGTSSRVYRRVAHQALAVADEVVFVGPNAKYVAKLGSDRLRTFGTVRAATDYLQTTLREGDLVVLKGGQRADHLLRILLARTTTVRCWRTSCGRSIFCDDCRLLHVPGGP